MNKLDLRDKKLSELLLKWYDKNKRSFPWRSNDLTPFQLFIAELLLQKTNAYQVEKIFPDFIKKYPDVKSLQKVSIDVLSEYLRPLGLFNRRARDLKRIANILKKENNTLPRDKKKLIKLPGIGNYIANALICFAFNEPIPIVDTNIGRIMKRLYSFPVKDAPSRDTSLFDKMCNLIPETDFKKFNYALLDLGALICKSRDPLCEKCPLTKICNYYLK